jgi:hypothetical protein
MINTVNNQSYINTYSTLQSFNQNIKTEQTDTQSGTIGTFFSSSDKITLSNGVETSPTYTNPLSTVDTKGNNFDMLQGIVLNMLKEQGISYKVADGDNQIDLSKITQADAQKLIAEDGYFGVDKTSSRIVDLATSIAGGDPTKIDAIKEGVAKGFQEALKAFGGTLPDISHDTYDAVMNKLDAWVQTAGGNQVTQPTG